MIPLQPESLSSGAFRSTHCNAGSSPPRQCLDSQLTLRMDRADFWLCIFINAFLNKPALCLNLSWIFYRKSRRQGLLASVWSTSASFTWHRYCEIRDLHFLSLAYAFREAELRFDGRHPSFSVSTCVGKEGKQKGKEKQFANLLFKDLTKEWLEKSGIQAEVYGDNEC